MLPQDVHHVDHFLLVRPLHLHVVPQHPQHRRHSLLVELSAMLLDHERHDILNVHLCLIDPIKYQRQVVLFYLKYLFYLFAHYFDLAPQFILHQLVLRRYVVENLLDHEAGNVEVLVSPWGARQSTIDCLITFPRSLLLDPDRVITLFVHIFALFLGFFFIFIFCFFGFWNFLR